MITEYALTDNRGTVASADPTDYPSVEESFRFDGMLLVKKAHPYWTVTNRVILAPRLLKSNPTLADLRRLARACGAAEEVLPF